MDDLGRALRHAQAALRGWGPLLGALLLAWSLLGLGRGLSRRALARRLARRLARAQRGEVDAGGLLAAHGYRVRGVQVGRELTLTVDDRPRRYTIRADYLVEGDEGALFVAEVKTGPQASDPLHVPTRRQLLEYWLGFAEVEGVLLVDMERGEVRRVRFHGL